MKYRILLLLALMCAIFVAAVGGTLAGYTDKAAFGFSIEPEMPVQWQSQQPIETEPPEKAAAVETEDTAPAPEEPGEAEGGVTDAPQQTSETEALPQK